MRQIVETIRESDFTAVYGNVVKISESSQIGVLTLGALCHKTMPTSTQILELALDCHVPLNQLLNGLAIKVTVALDCLTYSKINR